MLVLATPAQAVQALALFKEACTVVRVKNRFSPNAPLYGEHVALHVTRALALARLHCFAFG